MTFRSVYHSWMVISNFKPMRRTFLTRSREIWRHISLSSCIINLIRTAMCIPLVLCKKPMDCRTRDIFLVTVSENYILKGFPLWFVSRSLPKFWMRLYFFPKCVLWLFTCDICSYTLDDGDLIEMERFFSLEIQRGLYLECLTVDNPKYVDEFIE